MSCQSRLSSLFPDAKKSVSQSSPYTGCPSYQPVTKQTILLSLVMAEEIPACRFPSKNKLSINDVMTGYCLRKVLGLDTMEDWNKR